MKHAILIRLLATVIVLPHSSFSSQQQSINNSTNTDNTKITKVVMAVGTAVACYYLYSAVKPIVKPVVMRTRLGFHVSKAYNTYRYGEFTYNQIAGDEHCLWLGNDAISELNDGKKTPLFLGSIPTKKEHLKQLLTSVYADADKGKISLFTLNEPWECQTSGLSALVSSHPEVTQHNYPTPDFNASLFVDLLRSVHDLDHRDELNTDVSLLQCKAGRGRSALVAAAYVAHVLKKEYNQRVSADAIENYLISRRSQVKLTKPQKNALNNFMTHLDKAQKFDTLYQQHQKEIADRIKDVERKK